MRSLTNVLMLAGVIGSFTVQGKVQPFSSEDPKFLQKSCQEVVGIFNKKDQPGTYAALHTSMAEAMRAGYCIGVVQQYMKQAPSCANRKGDWFALANAISNLPYGEQQFNSVKVSELLKAAYCG